MKNIHRNKTTQTIGNQFLELNFEPSGEFENLTHLNHTDLQYLLSKVSPIISKKDTHWRLAIPAKLRLAITLRYLATGDSFKSLHFLFKVLCEIISKIVPPVCTALVEVLKNQVKVKKQIFWL
ncbi:protein ANTAGONIST OF LIKE HETEROCHROMATIN PROTEIN 1-like [Aphis craccivora]|uniref:Protein ANTAGONIST OF LIKE HETEROCHROMATIN PROTEIN 1-like n=1 Tax=Aphis craccivora TaxID=307492 RepID=A0A6G0XPY0_APHCR|nr:protein ANTAGONIST OF LIKE HETEROCHROMATIN PROTEIN 1-like [Aphis craccivora]